MTKNDPEENVFNFRQRVLLIYKDEEKKLQRYIRDDADLWFGKGLLWK